MRLGVDEYFMQIAHATKTRSTCPRAQVGAVLVSDGRIVSAGFNGAPHGAPHCSEFGCFIVDDHCRGAVHAEINALLHAEKYGDTIYVTHTPCLECLKAIINHGVIRIVYDLDYRDDAREQFIGWLANNPTTKVRLVMQRIRRES
jgi:dCMP deaminase